MATWQVQKAKAHLSELIEDAQTKGPQIITKHSTERAVVLSFGEYEALQSAAEATKNGDETKAEPRLSFVDFLLTAPKFETDEEYEEFLAACMMGREDTGRDIDSLFDEEDEEPARDAAA
jgi:prevent-host-death family protein